MASIKLGPIAADIRGSISGVVFSRNRGGNYTRNRTKPLNPGSSSQQTVRTILADVNARWRDTLTAGQRTAWDLYAAAIAMTNKLGETMHLTGMQHYIRSNASRLRGSLTEVDAGPTVLALPEKDSTLAVSVSEATQNMSVTFDNTLDWANEVGGALLIYASQGKNATINSFKGPYRYAGKIAGAGTPPTSPATIACPFTMTEGHKLFVRAVVVRADGRASEPFRVSCTVSA